MRKAGLGLTLLLMAALAWLALQLTQAPVKVVLISLDGAADGLVDDYLERGVLPADRERPARHRTARAEPGKKRVATSAVVKRSEEAGA